MTRPCFTVMSSGRETLFDIALFQIPRAPNVKRGETSREGRIFFTVHDYIRYTVDDAIETHK